jgi:type IV fimbrial biogenesis protein FimT
MLSRQKAFTLIELMIIITILGILLSIAVPSFSDWLQRKRLSAAASDYVALINYARSESIKRNTKIYLVATSGTNWKLIASTSDTCDVASTCNLLSMTPEKYNSINLASISDKLDKTAINPIDARFEFPSGSTTEQTSTFELNNYQLQINLSLTGKNKVCTPTGKPAILGYNAC